MTPYIPLHKPDFALQWIIQFLDFFLVWSVATISIFGWETKKIYI